MKTIYTITTIRPPHDTRIVGWFPSFYDAKGEVLNNSCDIYEGCYRFCIIEKIRPGLYPCPPENEWWFRWEGSWDEGGYKKVKKPQFFDKTVNFGIG